MCRSLTGNVKIVWEINVLMEIYFSAEFFNELCCTAHSVSPNFHGDQFVKYLNWYLLNLLRLWRARENANNYKPKYKTKFYIRLQKSRLKNAYEDSIKKWQ